MPFVDFLLYYFSTSFGTCLFNYNPIINCFSLSNVFCLAPLLALTFTNLLSFGNAPRGINAVTKCTATQYHTTQPFLSSFLPFSYIISFFLLGWVCFILNTFPFFENRFVSTVLV